MEENYMKIGEFLSPSHDVGVFVKRVLIQDNRGACVVSEKQWKKIRNRQNRNMIHLNSPAA